MSRKAYFTAVLVAASAAVLSAAETYDVRKFGAVGDKKAKDTAAFQAAVDACAKAGGGTVLAPPGEYLCGTIRLQSHVRLHLDAGATLFASREADDYGKGNRYLLIASKAERVSVVGPGTIRGIGDGDLGRRADKSDAVMPAFRPGILRFDECTDVTVRDLTILLSDTWTLHFRDCENVLVDGVTIRNHYFHTNSDGIDPVSCKNVRIANCHIVAGDDCIVIKTADKKPCENIVVTNCTLESIATAIKLGTESSGDFRNIHIANCSVRNSTVGIGIFLKDGGTMERITFSQIDIENYTPRGETNVEKSLFPIFVDIEKRNPDSLVGKLRDVTFSDITIASGTGVLVQGMPESPIENLTLRNVTFRVTEPLDYKERRKHIGGRRTTSDARDTLYARQPGYVVLAHGRRVVVDQLQVFLTDEHFAKFPRSALRGFELQDLSVRDIFRQPGEAKEQAPVMMLERCTQTPPAK